MEVIWNNQLLIGSTGYTGNLAQIGFGWTNAPIHFAPSVIAHVTTNQDSHTFGDLIFATRGTNADVAPAERMRIFSDGQILMKDRLQLVSGPGGIPLGDIPSGLDRASIGLKIEKSGPAFLEFSTPSNASGGIYFSDENFKSGQIIYDHAADAMTLRDRDGNLMRINESPSDVFLFKTPNPASGSFNLLKLATSNGADEVFRVQGDGSVFNATNVYRQLDYAEYFCGTVANAEIPIGSSVVLEDEKLRQAMAGENPIGVVRPKKGAAGIVGGSDWAGPLNKYLTDDYGSPIYEDVQFVRWTEKIEDENGVITKEVKVYRVDLLPSGVTVPEDAEYFRQTAQKLNPNYDPNAPFVPKSERPDCYVVGLLGQVPITKGQSVAASWVKIKDISGEVDLWLIK